MSWSLDPTCRKQQLRRKAEIYHVGFSSHDIKTQIHHVGFGDYNINFKFNASDLIFIAFYSFQICKIPRL